MADHRVFIEKKLKFNLDFHPLVYSIILFKKEWKYKCVFYLKVFFGGEAWSTVQGTVHLKELNSPFLEKNVLEDINSDFDITFTAIL